MATRATYEFKHDTQGDRHKRATVYIHYDGYPIGAAYYFYNTLCNPSHGDFATQFIRANDRAELTESHRSHGDTDYRYTLTGCGPAAMLEAYQRSMGENVKWMLFDSCPLHEFITRNSRMIREDTERDFSPFKLVKLLYREKWLNDDLARLELNAEHGALNHLRLWSQGDTVSRECANWQNCARELSILLDAFPHLATDEMRQLVA